MDMACRTTEDTWDTMDLSIEDTLDTDTEDSMDMACRTTEDTWDTMDFWEGRGGLQMLMLSLMPSLLRIPTCSMDTDWDTMVDTIDIRTTLDTMEDKQAECKQNTTTTSIKLISKQDQS